MMYTSSIKKYGFTLAELLITLAIIGIVAALTLPTLINDIQERSFHSKWKECYSILNNAFRMTVAENSGMVVPNKLSSEFVNAFISHLHYVDTCGLPDYDINRCDNSLNANSSRVKYKWSGISSNSVNTKYKSLSGARMNCYDFCNRAVLLKNGASIYFGGLHSGSTIVVDVNNFNGGPNVLGKDVYAINLYPSMNWYLPDVRIEDMSFIPHGAPGARCVGGNNCSLSADSFGVVGCSKDIGYVNDGGDSDYIVLAAGAGCSYKYLYEK